jgi:hypothetical protein
MTVRHLTPLDRPLDANLLARGVDGFGVAARSTLGDVLTAADDRATLLVFLRHYG